MQLSRSSRLRPIAAASAPSAMVGLAVAVVAGLLAGALTAYGHGWLSDATTSLAKAATHLPEEQTDRDDEAH